MRWQDRLPPGPAAAAAEAAARGRTTAGGAPTQSPEAGDVASPRRSPARMRLVLPAVALAVVVAVLLRRYR
jgi:hypothetical protein